MSQQNPTIPTATQAQGIDAVVNDLQTHLSFELSWLTEGMGRAYKMQRARTNGAIEFKPMVYLGTSTADYYAAVPDNDNTGQSVILVGDGVPTNQQRGFYSRYEYPVSIIFSANLDTINSTLLLTEDFTEHLMDNVRQALVRDLLGKYYQLEIVSETRQFEDVYSEFDVNEGTAKTSKPLLPMTYFRFNCLVSFEESCPSATLDRCTAIMNNLTSADLLTCILPTYDFSTTAVQDATTAQQQADMSTWLCVVPVVPAKSFVLDGVNEYVRTPLIASYELEYNSTITFGSWVKFDTVTAQTIWNKFTGNRGFFIIIQADGTVRVSFRSDLLKILDVKTNVGAINAGNWYYISVTYNGNSLPSGITIKINDVAQTINTIKNTLGANTILSPALTLKLGANDAGTGSLDGFMNDFRLWNTVLSTAQETTEYNLGTPNPTPESIGNLILWMEGARYQTFGIEDFSIEDSSGTADGFQTVNLEKADTSVDVPT